VVLRVAFVKHWLVEYRLLSLFILEINILVPTGCQNVVCANGGTCNTVPTIENGIEMQCSCLDGIKNLNLK
jgi:hypothetical protein